MNEQRCRAEPMRVVSQYAEKIQYTTRVRLWLLRLSGKRFGIPAEALGSARSLVFLAEETTEDSSADF